MFLWGYEHAMHNTFNEAAKKERRSQKRTQYSERVSDATVNSHCELFERNQEEKLEEKSTGRRRKCNV